MDICPACSTPLYEACNLSQEEKKKIINNYPICCRAKIMLWTPNHKLNTIVLKK